jgi:hypothetical protein
LRENAVVEREHRAGVHQEMSATCGGGERRDRRGRGGN